MMPVTRLLWLHGVCTSFTSFSEVEAEAPGCDAADFEIFLMWVEWVKREMGGPS